MINTRNEFSKMQLQWITIHLLRFVKPRKKRCNPPYVMNVDDTIFFVICVKGERSQNNSRIPSTSILLKQKRKLMVLIWKVTGDYLSYYRWWRNWASEYQITGDKHWPEPINGCICKTFYHRQLNHAGLCEKELVQVQHWWD